MNTKDCLWFWISSQMNGLCDLVVRPRLRWWRVTRMGVAVLNVTAGLRNDGCYVQCVLVCNCEKATLWNMFLVLLL